MRSALFVELHVRAPIYLHALQVADHGLRMLRLRLCLQLQLPQRPHSLFGRFNPLENHAQFAIAVQLARGLGLITSPTNRLLAGRISWCVGEYSGSVRMAVTGVPRVAVAELTSATRRALSVLSGTGSLPTPASCSLVPVVPPKARGAARSPH